MNKSPTTERIIAHAEMAATYLRALLANGVSLGAAIGLVSSYVSSVQIIEGSQQPPREPWEGDSPT